MNSFSKMRRLLSCVCVCVCGKRTGVTLERRSFRGLKKLKRIALSRFPSSKLGVMPLINKPLKEGSLKGTREGHSHSPIKAKKNQKKRKKKRFSYKSHAPITR